MGETSKNKLDFQNVQLKIFLRLPSASGFIHVKKNT